MSCEVWDDTPEWRQQKWPNQHTAHKTHELITQSNKQQQTSCTMRIKLLLLCSSTAASFAFAPSSRLSSPRCSSATQILSSSEPNTIQNDSETTTQDINTQLEVPLTYNEMILQTSQAITSALQTSGCKRQIIRILLPRDAANDNFGIFQEIEVSSDNSNNNALNVAQTTKLVPTDESWQGGIMQLYRACTPTTKDLVRELCPGVGGVPPKIVEDRSVDESGVDGVGLMYTVIGANFNNDEVNADTSEEESGMFGGFGFGSDVTLPTLSSDDVCAFIQPNQEVIDSIETLSNDNNDALIALINPQWRNVDDALDSASKNDNVFGAFASFLGGKGNSLKRLDSLGYTNTYTLEGYVCKGGNIRLLKRFDSDWIVFAENDAGDAWVRVGQQKERPRYQDVEKFLDDKGVGFKYARDLGMAPKL